MPRVYSDGVEGQPGKRPISTLAAGIAVGATSLSSAAGDGQGFPTTGDFTLRLEKASDPTHFEHVDCTARTTDTFTITPTTFAWAAGDKISHVLAKVDLDAKQAISEKGQPGGYAGQVLIDQTVLTGAAASITFSAIPQTYSHLLLVFSGRGDAAAASQVGILRFNGDTAANYDWEQLQGLATASAVTQATAATSLKFPLVCSGAPANYPSQQALFIPDYRRTTFYKAAALSYGGVDTPLSNMFVGNIVGWWRSTAAITSILISPSSGNYVAGTVASLYGLA